MTKKLQILNLQKRKGCVNLVLPLGGGTYGVNTAPVAPDIMAAAAAANLGDQQAVRSFFFDTNVNIASDQGPTFETVEDITPQDSDYIYPLFRALSAVIIPGYWVEFPADVLKPSVPLLARQTVFKNHDNEDVEMWLGSVNQTLWDQAGQFSDGVPGINAELKIDWKISPRIARGLLMDPPAIHSVSVTVVFTFDYSHPELEKEDHYRFMNLLGEEVDGQIVRLIANKVEAYREISLVTQGADGLAKRRPDIETDDEELSRSTQSQSAPPSPATSSTANPAQAKQVSAAAPTAKEKPTVKLTDEQKKKLGLEAVAGDDVDEQIVLGAVNALAARAEAGDTLLGAARAECLRVAGLAEADAEGKLPAAFADIINNATAAQLSDLTQMYTEKAAAKFKPTCQACGSTNVITRSSVEATPEETGFAAPAPAVNGASSLH